MKINEKLLDDICVMANNDRQTAFDSSQYPDLSREQKDIARRFYIKGTSDMYEAFERAIRTGLKLAPP